ncbi:hypothetical protein KQI84_13080 [bacterium]|nr:hypothetical protein [bacterium]
MNTPHSLLALLLAATISLFLTGCFGATPSQPLLLNDPPWQSEAAGDYVQLCYQAYSRSEPQIVLERINTNEIVWVNYLQYAGRRTFVRRMPWYTPLKSHSSEFAPNPASGKALVELQPPFGAYVPFGSNKGKTIFDLSTLIGSNRQSYRFLISWARLSPVPRSNVSERDFWWKATYVTWGLPRDILDAPITLMRRDGFDAFGGPQRLCGDDTMVTFVAFDIALTIAVPIVIAATVTPLYVGIPLAALGFATATWAAIFVTSYVKQLSSILFQRIINPLQTAALRGGVDSEDYFPNWKFGVHDRSGLAIIEEVGQAEEYWVITNIQRIP